ncbi:MAG: CARDB domain-containing protein [Segetibacter sp.]
MQYKDAEVVVTTKVKNYGTTAMKAGELKASLYNGTTGVPGATGKKAIPALKPGEEVTVDVNFNVSNPQKWTAETPKLYTTIITVNDGNRVIETLSSRTGFREIEIKGSPVYGKWCSYKTKRSKPA